MTRYAVGKNLIGFESLAVDSEKVGTIRDSQVVIILSGDDDNLYTEYYKAIKELIINNNKVVLVYVSGRSTIWKPLAMLMASYRRYDIYEVDNYNEITESYVMQMMSRTASEEEVRTFVSSEVIAYGELDSLLLDVSSAIQNGDVESAVRLLASKADIVEASIGAINYLRKTLNTLSSSKDDSKINELQELVNKLKKELDEARDKINELNDTNKTLVEENKGLEQELANTNNRLREIEEQMTSGAPVIRSYVEVQTSLVKCKAKSIIYFKEITYVRYVNSFVTKLFEVISKIHKLRVKLVIYDNRNGFVQIYKPLTVVGSAEYVASRDLIVNKTDKIVVVEANPAIIEDIIRADYDVVIVYDRMRQPNDVVAGNNVYKYWIINSATEYNTLSQTYKIDKHHVIARPGIFPESIPLLEISGYSEMTESARISSYIRLEHPVMKKSLFELILERTNVSSIAKLRR